MSLIVDGTTGVTFNDSSLQGAAASPFGLKNRIINGDMVIDQRNNGTSITGNDGAYAVDRWRLIASQSSRFTIQQNQGSVTPPAGFSNYLGASSSSAYSVLSGDFFAFVQHIEGFNTADLNWGTANAQTVTLSFRVRSSLTGTFGGSFTNSAQNYSYPFTYTISAANTWTTISITVPGPTAGTWIGATNGRGISVFFSLGMGSTYSGTSGSWAASGFYSATGATSVVGTNGATFYITGVQLERNTTATPFEWIPYGTELMLCQRYYTKIQATGLYSNFGNAVSYSSGGSSFRFQVYLPVQLRTSPSFTQVGSFVTLGVVAGSATIATVDDPAGTMIVSLSLTTPSAGSAGQAVIVRANNDTTAALTFNAEL